MSFDDCCDCDSLFRWLFLCRIMNACVLAMFCLAASLNWGGVSLFASVFLPVFHCFKDMGSCF